MRRTLLVVTAAIPPHVPGAAQSRFDLTIPKIMRGTENTGREPSDIRWSPDGRWIYFQWLPPGTGWKETLKPYRVRPAPGAGPQRLSQAAADSLEPMIAEGPLSPDRKRRVVSVRGDLFLVELPSGRVRRLTDTPAMQELDPSFDREGRRIFFRRDNNVLALDIVQGRRWRDSVEKAEREAREAGRPRPFYLAQGEQVAELDPSPAGNAVLVRLFTPPKDARPAQVPSYVTVSGYTEELPSRTKVGDAQATERLGVLTVATGAVQWVRPIAGDTSGRYAGIAFRGWNDAGTAALFFAWCRDSTARHLVRVDAGSARVTSIDVLRDTAWAGGAVGGPCDGCGGWLPGGEAVWLVSEAHCFPHLYTLNADGSDRRQRTRGRWEVLDAELTPDRSAWLLHTSEVSPFDRHAYQIGRAHV